MAWTAPRTWTDGELVTAAIMNPHIRDNQLAEGPHLIARKTSDQTNNTTTYAADTVLFTPSIGANEVWWLEWRLVVVVASPDPKFRHTFPSGGSIASVIGPAITGGRMIGGTTSPTGGGSPSWNNDASGLPGMIMAMFTNGATPGSVGLDWAANSAGTVTVKQNSTLWGVRIA